MKYKTKIDNNSPINIFNDNSKNNNVYIFESEIDEEEGYQLFVEKHIEEVLDLNLCLLKESSAGHGGAVDFLAIDDEGRIFLIEVKCSYDQRSKYDVVFQNLKYYLDPSSIAQELLNTNKKIAFKENDSTNEIKIKFNLSGSESELLAQKIYENLKGNHLNPIIVTDRASPQLIATAYSLLMRNTGSECKVVELNEIEVDNKKYVYSRKYSTTDDWVSVGNENIRTPHLTKEERLDMIHDPEIKQLFAKIIEKIEKKAGLQFNWNSPNTSHFNITYKQAGGRKYTLGIYFITNDYFHSPSNEHLKSGSLWLISDYDLHDFIIKNKLDIEYKKWKSQKHINYYFILKPEYMLELQSNKIVEIVTSYKDFYLSHKS